MRSIHDENVIRARAMRLLVVEDEPKTAAFLCAGLMDSGFSVDVATTGDEALAMSAAAAFDMVILDVMLPGRDGWAVLGELRRRAVPPPVLFLSAVGSTADRVRGLELGADDYLAKPFAFSELLARVRSVLRRGPQRRVDVLAVADLELDLVQLRASRAGQRLDLTAKEFQLLSLLMRRAGDVVTRRVIAEQVWQMHFDPGTNVVDVHIRRLRAKVDEPFPRKLIHTVRGMGYVLEDRG
jgi:two-component system copper resistance phosphate regulon response regulator CusR